MESVTVLSVRNATGQRENTLVHSKQVCSPECWEDYGLWGPPAVWRQRSDHKFIVTHVITFWPRVLKLRMVWVSQYDLWAPPSHLPLVWDKESVIERCHIWLGMNSQGSKYCSTSCFGFPLILCLMLILFSFTEGFGWIWVQLCSLLCVEVNDSWFITLITVDLVFYLVVHLSSLSDSN